MRMSIGHGVVQARDAHARQSAAVGPVAPRVALDLREALEQGGGVHLLPPVLALPLMGGGGVHPGRTRRTRMAADSRQRDVIRQAASCSHTGSAPPGRGPRPPPSPS